MTTACEEKSAANFTREVGDQTAVSLHISLFVFDILMWHGQERFVTVCSRIFDLEYCLFFSLDNGGDVVD